MRAIEMIGALARHLNYLFWHKIYVFQAGRKRNVPLGQLIVHDWSKFLPSEMLPYTRHFFMGDGSKNSSSFEPFMAAFRLHYRRNPHHWEHWNGKEMPYRYVLEMLADWDGTGLSKNGVNDTVAYYSANRQRIVLHPKTRLLVEHTLACECHTCVEVLSSNLGVIIDDGGLTDQQVSDVTRYLRELHQSHV